MKYIFLIITLFITGFFYAQNKSTVYQFRFQNKKYEIVKENKSWAEATADAVKKGGYLAQINSKEEQEAIFKQLQKAGIKLFFTTALDGGGASYVWLGGTDHYQEGKWIWDGDNNGEGLVFWIGGVNGHTVNNSYVNWGHEPDDYNNKQDALAMALTQWPINSGRLGKPGQWNDLDMNNSLYYVIEYPLQIKK